MIYRSIKRSKIDNILAMVIISNWWRDLDKLTARANNRSKQILH